MSEHIDMTIRDLEAERGRLAAEASKVEEMIQHLRRFGEAVCVAPSPARPRLPSVNAQIAALIEKRQEVPTQPPGAPGQDTAVRIKLPLPAARATTVSGAMKQVLVASLERPLTRQEVFAVLSAEYPRLMAKAGDVDRNLAYWANTERLVKVGLGPQAAYRVVDEAWFSRVTED